MNKKTQDKVGRSKHSGPMPARDEVTVRQIDKTLTTELHCDSPTMKEFRVEVKTKNLDNAIERFEAQGYTVNVIRN